MTLNGHFALISFLCRYAWNSEAWLSELGYSETCTECCRKTSNRKEQLRHRAVSLLQHIFLVQIGLGRALSAPVFDILDVELKCIFRLYERVLAEKHYFGPIMLG